MNPTSGTGTGPERRRDRRTGTAPETVRHKTRDRAALASRDLAITALVEPSNASTGPRGGADQALDDPTPDGWSETDSDDDWDLGVPVTSIHTTIRFYLVGGDLECEIAPPATTVDDLDLAARWEHRLYNVADQLALHHGDAVVAADVADAYRKLARMTKGDFARWVSTSTSRIDDSALSRLRSIKVQCLWGVVPLAFFFWGNDQPDENYLAVVNTLLERIASEPEHSNSQLAKVALEEQPWDGTTLDTFRRQTVPFARRLVAQRVWVQHFRTQPHLWETENFDPHFFPDKDRRRGLNLLRAALVGDLEIPIATAPDRHEGLRQ